MSCTRVRQDGPGVAVRAKYNVYSLYKPSKYIDSSAVAASTPLSTTTLFSMRHAADPDIPSLEGDTTCFGQNMSGNVISCSTASNILPRINELAHHVGVGSCECFAGQKDISTKQDRRSGCENAIDEGNSSTGDSFSGRQAMRDGAEVFDMVASLWLHDGGARYPLLSKLPLVALLEQRYVREDDTNKKEDVVEEGYAENAGNSFYITTTMAAPAVRRPSVESRGECEPSWYHMQHRHGGIDVSSSYENETSLRSAVWGGCEPSVVRAVVWRVLCDYAPASVARQRPELSRKRSHYMNCVHQYYDFMHVAPMFDSPLKQFSSLAASRVAVSPKLPTAASAPSVPGVAAAAPSSSSSGGAVASCQGSRICQVNSGIAVSALCHNGRAGAAASRVDSTSGNAHIASSRRRVFPNGQSMPHRGQMTTARYLTSDEKAILRQIMLDLSRHAAALFHCRATVFSLTRCLFFWARRNPAVGYVQGVDDIVSLIYLVFLTDALIQHSVEKCSNTEPVGSASSSESTSIIIDSRSSSRDRNASVNPSGPSVVVQGYADTSAGGFMGIALVRYAVHLYVLLQRTNTTTQNSTPELISALVMRHCDETRALSIEEVSCLSCSDLDATVNALPHGYLLQVEADTFSCADSILSELVDNFIPGMPGIARQALLLESIVVQCSSTGAKLLEHLSRCGMTVMHGCFQWLHCLLARDLPLGSVLSLWDTYLAMGRDDWPTFHVYVCAALFLAVQDALLRSSTEELLTVLKDPLTYAYTCPTALPQDHRHAAQSGNAIQQRRCRVCRSNTEILIADAYRLWHQSPPSSLATANLCFR